jgi:hypothetical protein
MTLVLLVLRQALRLLLRLAARLAALLPAPGSATGQLVVLWAEEKPEPDGTWTRALRVLVHIRRLPAAASPVLHALFRAALLSRRLGSAAGAAGRRLRGLFHRLRRALDSA